MTSRIETRDETKEPAATAGAATPRGGLREFVDDLADDVRYAGGNGTSDYWRGFNDGIAKFAVRLTDGQSVDDFDPLGDTDHFRALRDALFDGLVAVDRGDRLRVLDADASAAVLVAAIRPRLSIVAGQPERNPHHLGGDDSNDPIPPPPGEDD